MAIVAVRRVRDTAQAAGRSGSGTDGTPVFLKDVWPSAREVAEVVQGNVTREQFQRRYGEVFKGPPQWQRIEVEGGTDTYRWNDGSTYVKNPPYFTDITPDRPARTTSLARASLRCSAIP